MKNQKITDLVNAFLQSKTQEDVLDLLKGLLTTNEIDEMARRIQIIKLLKAGIPQRSIVSKLNVGIATVTRGSKELQKGRFKHI